MELSKLKEEFKDYLNTLNASSKTSETDNNDLLTQENENKKYELNNPNVSLFSYAEEFDNFLNNVHKNEADNLKINTDEILKLKFENGKFIQENTEAGLVDILNDLLTDEKMKTIIDSNGDNQINQEEVKEFLVSIEDIDGKKGDISISDLLTGTKKIQELDLSSYATNNKSTPAVNKRVSSIGEYGNIVKSSGSYNNMPNISVSAPANTFISEPIDYSQEISSPEIQQSQDMNINSLEELQQKKIEKEEEVNIAQKEYTDVSTGVNKNVMTALDTYQSAKEYYFNLLEKEKNIEIEQKNQLTQAVANVESASQFVDDANIKLQESENLISEQEGIVSQNKSNLSSLQASLASVQEQITDNPDQKTELESKILELTSQISTAEQQLQESELKLQELVYAKDEVQNDLSEKELELENLQESKGNLEEEIIENNEIISQELKTSLDDFNVAEENLQTVKENEMSIKQDELESSENDLQEINNQIDEKEAEQQSEIN